MKLYTILPTLIVSSGFYFSGANVNLTVQDGLFDVGVFECNKPITFRCRVNPNSGFVQWFVGKQIGQASDADCIGITCEDSRMFPGRYYYTIDNSAGISDLKIENATFDDDQMIYQCSNGSVRDSYNATAIKSPAKPETTAVNVTQTTDRATVTLITGCIYPVQDLNIVWYSTLTNGSDLKNHTYRQQTNPCTPTPNCMNANTRLESTLDINTTTTGQERVYSVNISFGSLHFSKDVGKFNVTQDSTASKVGTKSPLSTGAIVGIVIASIIVVVIIVLIVLKCCTNVLEECVGRCKKCREGNPKK